MGMDFVFGCVLFFFCFSKKLLKNFQKTFSVSIITVLKFSIFVLF